MSSLVDALLNDPWRDPHDIYIALRADGQRGSGTIDDPYDGGARLGTPLEGSLTFNRREFLVTTPGNHGLSVGNTIKIRDITGGTPQPDWPGKGWFVGETFTVHSVLSPRHFTALFTRDPQIPLPLDPQGSHQFAPNSQYTPLELELPGEAKTDPRIYWPVAKVSVPSQHGLSPYDAIQISDVATPGFEEFENDYPILGLSQAGGTAFALRLHFLPAADIRAGETLESLVCVVRRVAHRFDEVMRAAPEGAVIHLAPGEFETRGYAGLHIANDNDYNQVDIGFVIRRRQRLLGAGMGCTTLKLVLPLDDRSQTSLIGNGYRADGVEVADLTLDCNAPGHPAPYGIYPAPVTCGAVGFGGSFIRLSRLRAIRFCVQTGPECFVLYLTPGYQPSAPFPFPPPIHNIIEDCVVEQPGLNNTHETSLMGNVGSHYGNGVSPVIRNNFIDCRYRIPNAEGPPLVVSNERIRVLDISTPGVTPGQNFQEFTITTLRPFHGDVVLLNFVYWLDNSNPTQPEVLPHPYFNRLFVIKSRTSATEFTCQFEFAPADFPSTFPDAYITDTVYPSTGVNFQGPGAWASTGGVVEGNSVHDCWAGLYTDTGSSRDMVVRNNYYSNVGVGAYLQLPPGQLDAFRIPSAIVPEVVTVGGVDYKCGVFTTIQPHELAANDRITIREAGTGSPHGDNPYHGTNLEVVEARGAAPSRQFVYKLANQSANLPTDNCLGRPVVVKQGKPDGVSIASLVYSSVTGLVTATTVPNQNHLLVTGDFVAVFDAKVGATEVPGHNGIRGPVTRLSDTQFSYEFQNPVDNPIPDADSGKLDRLVATGVVRNGNVATVTTASEHGYFLNQLVLMGGARVGLEEQNGYNGFVKVSGVSKRQFSYAMRPIDGVVPGGTASPTGPVVYAAHWDIRSFSLLGNLYELYQPDAGSGVVPTGVSMAGLNPDDSPPYLFPEFICSENVFRPFDAVDTDASAAAAGIVAWTIGAGLISDNIVELRSRRALEYRDHGPLTHLKNQRMDGTPLHGYNLDAYPVQRQLSSAETLVQDALTMSLL